MQRMDCPEGRDFMFLNFSNHPSSLWGQEQLNAARCYGPIRDLSFPQVDPEADPGEIRELARKYTQEILLQKPDCVLCQGEFCFCYQIISSLLKAGVRVVAACTKRDSREIMSNGATEKVSYFRFVQFREYCQPESPAGEHHS